MILVPSLVDSVAIMVIPSGAIAIAVGYFLFKRDKKKEALDQ